MNCGSAALCMKVQCWSNVEGVHTLILLPCGRVGGKKSQEEELQQPPFYCCDFICSQLCPFSQLFTILLFALFIVTGLHTWPTKSAYFAQGLYHFDVSFSRFFFYFNLLALAIWFEQLIQSLFRWTVAQGLGQLIEVYYNEKDLKRLKKEALCVPCPS